MFLELSRWLRVGATLDYVRFQLTRDVAKIPSPKDTEGNEEVVVSKKDAEVPLPQTLVRIPTDQAPLLAQQTSSGVTEGT